MLTTSVVDTLVNKDWAKSDWLTAFSELVVAELEPDALELTASEPH